MNGGLLKELLQRAQKLINRSVEIANEGDEDQRLMLLSGDASTTNGTEPFLRPLSKGATVMLTRTLKELVKLQEMFTTQKGTE